MDKESAIKFINASKNNFKKLNKEFKNDRDIILAALRKNGNILEQLRTELKNDREFILDLVKRDGILVHYASEELKNDREVVLEAAKQNKTSLKYASDILKKDKSILKEISRKNKTTPSESKIEFSTVEKESLLKTIESNPKALKDVNEELKNNREFILEAIKTNSNAIDYIGKFLKKDKDFVEECQTIKRNNEKKVILDKIKSDLNVLRKIDPKLCEDPEILEEIKSLPKEMVQNKLLEFSSLKSESDAFKLLLKTPNIDINFQDDSGNTALMLASKKGIIEKMTEILSVPNVDINVKGKLCGVFGDIQKATEHSALDWAAINNMIDAVKLLLTHSNIEIDSCLVLLAGSTYNIFDDVAKEILNHPKCDPNIPNLHKEYTIVTAARKNKTVLLNLVLTHPKTDINIQDSEGYTALMYAAKNNMSSSVELILKNPTIEFYKSTFHKKPKTVLDYLVENSESENMIRLFDYKIKNKELLERLKIDDDLIRTITAPTKTWKENLENIELLVKEMKSI